MAAFKKFNCLIADLANKKHNLGADTLKMMLTNVAPLATNTVKANITEIAAGNGYTAGGVTIPIASSSQVDGLYSLAPSGDVTITASGGAMATFRYAVFYNSTDAAGALISYYDYGQALTLNAGESILLDMAATLLTIGEVAT